MNDDTAATEHERIQNIAKSRHSLHSLDIEIWAKWIFDSHGTKNITFG